MISPAAGSWVPSGRMMAGSGIGEGQPAGFAEPLQDADRLTADAVEETDPAARIVDGVGAVEGGAEHGGVRHLAAIAAADAALVDMGDRVVAQRVVERFDRQRRAAGQ